MKRIALYYFLLQTMLSFSAQAPIEMFSQEAMAYLINAFFYLTKMNTSSLPIVPTHELSTFEHDNNFIMNFTFRNNDDTKLSVLIPYCCAGNHCTSLDFVISCDKGLGTATIEFKKPELLQTFKNIQNFLKK